ncbi:MAG: hypothetical protein KGI97_03460 [Alphaproteobacteria bacterium]|nr:hypothetical protein [Alphaproteobacteria bacterium]
MTIKDTVSNALDTVTATIASSATTSGTCSLGGLRLFGMITPAALTGTALTILASADGVNFAPLYDITGAQVSIAAAPSRYIALDPVLYAALPYVKLVSNAAEAAARDITLVLRDV